MFDLTSYDKSILTQAIVKCFAGMAVHTKPETIEEQEPYFGAFRGLSIPVNVFTAWFNHPDKQHSTSQCEIILKTYLDKTLDPWQSLRLFSDAVAIYAPPESSKLLSEGDVLREMQRVFELGLEDSPEGKDFLELLKFWHCDEKQWGFMLAREYKRRNETRKASEVKEDKPDEGRKKPKIDSFRRFHNFLESNYSNRLSFCELTRDIYLDIDLADLDYLYPVLRLESGISIPKDGFFSLIYLAAKKNPFHPFKRLLERARQAEAVNLDTLATRYFGSLNPICNTFLKKWLVSLIARIYDPGNKADSMLVLAGDQGFRKSSFFEVLIGENIYPNMSKFDKDDILGAVRSVVVLVDELDRVFGKKESATLKDWLTRREDLVREPYGRQYKRIKRGYIFAGTTNKTDFLKDPTGSRRYWVIPVLNRIDINLLHQERLGILKAALEAYEMGADWWLTPEEELERIEQSQNFEEVDPWLPLVQSYTSCVEETTTHDILFNQLDFEANQATRADERRVGAILTQLGFTRKRIRENGNRIYKWYKNLNLKNSLGTLGTEENSIPETFTPKEIEGVLNTFIPLGTEQNPKNPESPTDINFEAVPNSGPNESSLLGTEESIKESVPNAVPNVPNGSNLLGTARILTEQELQDTVPNVPNVPNDFLELQEIRLEDGTLAEVGLKVKLPDGSLAEIVWIENQERISVELDNRTGEPPIQFSAFSLKAAHPPNRLEPS